MPEHTIQSSDKVLTLADVDRGTIQAMLESYGLRLEIVAAGADIPGSFWGDSEAGLIGARILARLDTPVHSILHEAGHYICMDSLRRGTLHTTAGGDYDEESAVCYLQILLADQLPDVGRTRLQQDMDDWGYSFRLGSTARWFEGDAEDARAWLIEQDLIDGAGHPTGHLRR